MPSLTTKVILIAVAVVVVIIVVCIIVIVLLAPHSFTEANPTSVRIPHEPNPYEFYMSMVAKMKADDKKTEYPYIQFLAMFKTENSDKPNYFIGISKENKKAKENIILSLPNSEDIIQLKGAKRLFRQKNTWEFKVREQTVQLYLNNQLLHTSEIPPTKEMFLVNEIQINNTIADYELKGSKFWLGKLYSVTTGPTGNRRIQKFNKLGKLKNRIKQKKEKPSKSIQEKIVKEVVSNL